MRAHAASLCTTTMTKAVLLSLVGTLAAYFTIRSGEATETQAAAATSALASASADTGDNVWHRASLKTGQVPNTPTYETLSNAEVVWQKPEGQAKGVLFVAHGCAHGAIDFWYKCEACPTCTGLPEEVHVREVALSMGYAVVAVSSQDRSSKCWSLGAFQGFAIEDGKSDDFAAVSSVLGKLLPREGLDKVPLYGMGASSGGAFVLLFALSHPFAAICSQIMAVPPNFLKSPEGAAESSLKYPPTMFVHMVRDTRTAKYVELDMGALKEGKVPAYEVQVRPAPLTETLLSDQYPVDFNAEQSSAIYRALKTGGLLDDKGMLLHNPRHFNWREVLLQAKVPGVEDIRMDADLSPLAEILNLLFAGHEIIGGTTAHMLQWFEEHRLPSE